MSDARTGQKREITLRDESADEAVGGRRSILATGLALLAACVALFLVWQTVSSLLIVFAGVLFAAFLDASARVLAPILPLNRAWRLTLVLLLLSTLSGFGLAWGMRKLPEQTRLLLKVMDTQVDVLQEHLMSYAVDLLGPDEILRSGYFPIRVGFSATPKSCLAEPRAFWPAHL